MRNAIGLASENVEAGGGPFGALVVKNGKIIAKCGNRVTEDNDPTAHAEVVAIREASRILGTWDLSGCELYCSCEPCPMCLGAIYWAHIESVFYGANREDAQNAGFDDLFIYEEIGREPGSRSIKMRSLLREEALKPFVKWINFPGKTKY